MNTLILVAALLYGACIGSFLNVCIFRLPRRCIRIWWPKLSFCPQCRRTLPWYENLPLVAYLFLRGKCRGCKARIPPRYFFVELGTALLFVYVAQRTLVAPWEAAFERHWGEAFTLAALGAALIVCAAIDAEHRIIPDEIDIPGFLVAPLVMALVPSLLAGRAPDIVGGATELRISLESALPWWGLPAGVTDALTWPLREVESIRAGALAIHEPAFRAFVASVVGAAFGGGLIFAIGWAGDRLFHSAEGAMGFGDVKFMAMIGGFTGWQGVLGTIAIASMTGALWGIASKFVTGRRTVLGKDLAETTLLGYLALRLFGAPTEAPDGQPLALRPGGWIAAKFATGEPYLAFGPFLALGAFLIIFWPSQVWVFFTGLGNVLRGGGL